MPARTLKPLCQNAALPVIGTQDGPPLHAHHLEKLTLGIAHRLDRAEPLEMGRGHIRDEGDLGHGNLRQPPDLARPVHPHLEYRPRMIGLEAQHLMGQPHQVVEISLAFQRRASLFQNGRRHLLRRGLAVAPGHRHHPDVTAPPMPAGEIPESRQGIRHRDGEEAIPAGHRPAFFDEHPCRALVHRRLKKIVTVEVRAAQRNEKRLHLEPPRIRAHARRHRFSRAPEKLSPGRLGNFPRRKHGRRRHTHHLPNPMRRSAARASSRSSNGRRSRPTI